MTVLLDKSTLDALVKLDFDIWLSKCDNMKNWDYYDWLEEEASNKTICSQFFLKTKVYVPSLVLAQELFLPLL